LTLGPQLEAFLQKYPFASSRVLVQHFLMSVPTVKEILQRELGLKNSRGAGCPIFCPPAQKVSRAEVSTKMPQILRELEENHFEGIAAGDESWFQYSSPSPKTFA
jgi:hypothetical protein